MTSPLIIASLCHLTFRKNRIHAHFIHKVTCAIGCLSNLLSLDLGENGLEYAGAQRVCDDTLRHMPHLTRLNLGGNFLGIAGAKCVSDTLTAHNRNITDLNMFGSKC
eukprot:c10987_g1_i2.p1 GENE.c10987_g1_i2~~c10987_g1_i2.p1  ORF type:complete len:107 (-),score=19.48 c10987_g1_i2:65-385(-)